MLPPGRVDATNRSKVIDMNASSPPERLPPLAPEAMTPEQRLAAADIASGPRGELPRPFVAFLRSPGLMQPVQKMGEYLRYGSKLDRRIMEFATLIAARSWTQQYEWQAHYGLAMKAGLRADIALAVAEGRRPTGMAADEEAVYDLLTEVLRNQCVSDATYARAVALFGEPGVVDLVGLTGYYVLLAMVMNMARTALPAGVTPPLPPLP
jgi:4-carboxymuconolactone decarboxylase